ncbi:hypothetical protein OROGR_003519 [Orobanche gracilis]
MALGINNKEMSFVLSNDAKPRMKWTQDLHQRFVDAINHLGGAEKATPKSLMRVMAVHGLTLYHLKSHLQIVCISWTRIPTHSKYRLRKGHQSQTCHQNKEKGNGENQKCQWTDKISIGAQEETDDHWHVAQALQMQTDVQKKLHEQLEVQKHLHLRIEAQGKYLQSVVERAQETLCGYSFCSNEEVERVKVQLSQLVSMVDSGCPSSSSCSVLTEDDDRSMLKHERNKMSLGHNEYYSVGSSLASSESSKRNEGIPVSIEDVDNNNKGKRHPTMLSLMEMHPDINNIEPGNRTSDRKKSKNGCGLKFFDLNYELDSGCNGVERFSSNFY